MVGLVLLILVLAVPAWAWEITVAFTTDLHAATARFPQLAPLLQAADVVLDGGDAWEDTRRFTTATEAWATMRWMGEAGYRAMVLGNHETYLGPRLLQEILEETPFAVLATNLRAPVPTQAYAVLEVKGVRILLLGVLWDLAVIWPGWEILDPLAAIGETLAQAPEHDLFILLGHMSTPRAVALAQQLPRKCDLFVLGHDHALYEEPLWVQGIPIVQAGSHGQAVGWALLGPEGLREYRLVRVPAPPELPALPFWPVLVLGLFLWGTR
ncbi:MAG: metallophosphoesterase [Candidatus Bipolaricaulaceae bacterium]